ncbi:MAG: hypothetical protein V4506_00160, partial [Bacteroidota bacterium]
MCRKVTIVFILFCFAHIQAQNLVPNPSFEFNNNCLNARLENLVNWCQIGGGGGNAIYFNPCHNDAYITTPFQYHDSCFQSYQSVRTGVTYINIANYTQTGNSESKIPFVKLIDTLKAGKTYCVTYYISMFNNARYSLDKMGALFTATPFPCWSPALGTPSMAIAGLHIPQIVTQPGMVFEDTLNWMEVSGTFTAVGNEAYLAIGDFFTHAQHYIKDSYPLNCNGLAEYYLDDVSVEEVHPARAASNQTISIGDSLLVGDNPSEAAAYSWQPVVGLSCIACANPKASPSVTTTYTVTKTQCKAVTTDTITITVGTVGFEEYRMTNTLRLLPNPVNEWLYVSTQYDMQRIEIHGVTGQLVSEQIVSGKQAELSV